MLSLAQVQAGMDLVNATSAGHGPTHAPWNLLGCKFGGAWTDPYRLQRARRTFGETWIDPWRAGLARWYDPADGNVCPDRAELHPVPVRVMLASVRGAFDQQFGRFDRHGGPQLRNRPAAGRSGRLLKRSARFRGGYRRPPG